MEPPGSAGARQAARAEDDIGLLARGHQLFPADVMGAANGQDHPAWQGEPQGEGPR